MSIISAVSIQLSTLWHLLCPLSRSNRILFCACPLQPSPHKGPVWNLTQTSGPDPSLHHLLCSALWTFTSSHPWTLNSFSLTRQDFGFLLGPCFHKQTKNKQREQKQRVLQGSPRVSLLKAQNPMLLVFQWLKTNCYTCFVEFSCCFGGRAG